MNKKNKKKKVAKPEHRQPKMHEVFWKTRAGEILRFEDMAWEHLLNARALLRRRITRYSEYADLALALDPFDCSLDASRFILTLTSKLLRMKEADAAMTKEVKRRERAAAQVDYVAY